jgi:hypothetical protein
MRRLVMSVVVLLTVWLVVADSASARGRRKGCSSCAPAACSTCQKAAPCCQPSGGQQPQQAPATPVPEAPKALPPAPAK